MFIITAKRMCINAICNTESEKKMLVLGLSGIRAP